MARRRRAARRAADGAHAAVTAAGPGRDAGNNTGRGGAGRNRALAGERPLSAFGGTTDAAASAGAPIRAGRAAADRVLRRRTRADDRVPCRTTEGRDADRRTRRRRRPVGELSLAQLAEPEDH